MISPPRAINIHNTKRWLEQGALFVIDMQRERDRIMPSFYGLSNEETSSNPPPKTASLHISCPSYRPTSKKKHDHSERNSLFARANGPLLLCLFCSILFFPFFRQPSSCPSSYPPLSVLVPVLTCLRPLWIVFNLPSLILCYCSSDLFFYVLCRIVEWAMSCLQ